MNLEFVIGAILGSGAAIAFGRAPAEKLLAAVHNHIARRRR